MNLYPHQKEVLEKTKHLNNVGYFLEMGLGKTFIGAEQLNRYGKTKNLIVCQKSKINDWISHFKLYYKNLCFDLTSSSGLASFISQNNFSYGFINYELAWRREKELIKLKDFTLLLDESSLIQNPSAKQTKFILKLKPAHVILLSGTPVGGKYENLWSQIHLLGWDITKNTYNNQYVNWTTLEVSGLKIKIVDKSDPYKNIDRLKRKMREHGAVFMKTEEVFDLPKQNFIKIKVPKTSEYEEFMKKGILEDMELVGDTTLTKMLYARQLCGQYNEYKLSAFKDLIQSTGDRLIVFYSFNEELEKLKQICIECNKPISEVNGHTRNLDNYEKESNSVTLVQYRAGSKGLNLQKCNKIVYFTLPLSSEDFEQSKKRIHRIGQEKVCFYYTMICVGSIEEKILKTLELRRDFTNELFKNI